MAPSKSGIAAHVAAIAGYIVIAILFTWPLVLHPSDTLTGSPTGDTGAYVWNQWVFQHELLDHHSTPYFTHHLFGGGRRANLSLHNYTTFANLIALPLVRPLGVVTTFNLVYLLMTVLTAYCMFLLGRDVSGSNGVGWLSGLLFAWSPFMVTRGMGHFSLVAAAPLPVLLLLLRRAERRDSVLNSLGIGATIAWAAGTDVYYAVYALLLMAMFIAARVLRLRRQHRDWRALDWALDLLIVGLAALVLAIAVSGGWEFRFLGRSARMRTLYNPVMALTIVVLVRFGYRVRPSIGSRWRQHLWSAGRLAATSGVVAAVLMSPVLYAVSERLIAGDFNRPAIYWRSSPPGIDLVALLLPNPNHPLSPPAVAHWLGDPPKDYLENVGSIPWTALGVLILALWRGWRSPRWAVALTIAFALLALGPFVQVAGLNTHVPGPWALFRYVPVVELARTPARFVSVLMLMVAVQFAFALAWLIRHQRLRPAVVMTTVGAILVFELLPAPRPLYAATIPSIFKRVAAAPEDITVLQLPFGIRDGTFSIGDFSAQTEFFQTAHGKTVMGGYLSRVSERRRRELRGDPVLSALATMSEHQPLTPEQRQALNNAAADFTNHARIGFVVVDTSRATAELRDTAIAAFHLEFVDRDGVFELYKPPDTVTRPLVP